MSVSTPMAMVAMTMRRMTMEPWTTSVRKEILNPPRAEDVSIGDKVSERERVRDVEDVGDVEDVEDVEGVEGVEDVEDVRDVGGVTMWVMPGMWEALGVRKRCERGWDDYGGREHKRFVK